MVPDQALDPTQYLNVARYWAHRYAGTADYEDLFQVACVGLLSARDTWAPGMGSQVGHVHFHVRRALWLQGRSRRRQRHARNGEPVVSLDAVNQVGKTLHEVVEGGTLPVHLVDHPRAMAAIQSLPTKERLVLELRYGLAGDPPASTVEIGERLGLTLQGVRDVEHRAISRLRKRLR